MYDNMLSPGGFNPTAKKPLPFPLENIEENLADIYFDMDKVRKRIEVAKRNNVTNQTPARIKQLTRMQYKINTAMAIIRDLTKSLDSFWV